MRRNMSADVGQFPRDVVELQSYFRAAEPGQRVIAVPGEGLDVPLWILGSSTFGAELAAELGLQELVDADDFSPALAFDLTIRSKTHGAQSLDDVMLALWQRYGRDFYKGKARGVTPAEVEALFDEIAGTRMKPFFERYIRGTDDVPLSQTAAELEAFEPEAPGVDRDAFWMGEEEAAESGFLADDQPSPDMPDLEEVPNPEDQQAWSVQSLNTGSWVDLALGGVWVRAQLTWASPHRTLFMFISGGGMAHSMSKRTMDRLRGLGLIRLVSDGRVMDNALDAVAQAALRNDMGKASDEG